MSDLVICSCLSVYSLNLFPCLLYVELLSSTLFGVHPIRDLIPLMLESLMKSFFLGVVPSRMTLSSALTFNSRSSSLVVSLSSCSVLVFAELVWLFAELDLVIGNELARTMVSSSLLAPVLLLLAFSQLFFVVRSTSWPDCLWVVVFLSVLPILTIIIFVLYSGEIALFCIELLSAYTLTREVNQLTRLFLFLSSESIR